METKNAFFEEVHTLLSAMPDLYIVTVDLAGPPFDKIRAEYPKQYISAGIAEQNAVQIACGMALCGKKVVVYGVDPFITGRAFDQIRNCVALMGIPIVIAGANAGIASDCGITHSAMEQMSLMSVCPGLKSIFVSDNRMARLAAHDVWRMEGPVYLRFDAASEPELPDVPIDWKKGFRILREGRDSVVVSMGCAWRSLLPELDAMEQTPTLIDLFSYPFDKKGLLDILAGHGAVVTYEEHFLRGGLGSILLELMNESGLSIPVKRIGIDTSLALPQTYADHSYRLQEFMIEPERVTSALRELSR